MNFIEKLGLSPSVDMKGYTEDELDKLEKLYDIDIKGQLREFLIDIGRSFGSVLGDECSLLYASYITVRNHILIQYEMAEEIKSCGFKDMTKKKSFIISTRFETQEYFLLTGSDEPDQIYHYDSNKKVVEKTEWDLVGFFKMLIDFRERHPPRKNVVCRGELLLIK